MGNRVTFQAIKAEFPASLLLWRKSENAIKIQIWITLIANLLLSVMERGLKRSWSFSVFATMGRITLMYYVDFYNLFNQPQKDWERCVEEAASDPPPMPLFREWGLELKKHTSTP